MFKSLKQKLESEKVETSSLSSESDVTVNPSTSSLNQFDESLNSNHKKSNSNLSGENEGKRNNTNGHESILKWMMNKSSSSSQDISSLNQRSNTTTTSTNLTSSLRPTSRSSVTLNESSSFLTSTNNDSQNEEKLQWENVRLREQVKLLSRKIEAADTNDGKPVDQIDDKLLKMVAELIAKESSENNQPKESNGAFKSTSGNWSSLLLPPISQINNITDDQHKQEIDKLQKRINELEESLREKNKTIRLQQQRINDIRKSFQKGSTLDNKLFDFPGNHNDNESTTTTDGSSSNNLTTLRSENGFIDHQQQQQQVNLPNHNHSNNHSHHHQRQLSDSQSPLNCPMNNISWQYLRSVIFKFVLTSDYEAQKHLVKAISMILQFSDAEEKQIRDSLEQKVSWFKNLPLLGNGFKYNNQHNNNSNNSNHH
ncbi:putative uncharacterized protein DDB_G0277255 [Panonychus citri]|uniref:putative uncharacterized protein DDB_G0277255 n=1 Tax=Panonychus citri TaxID=50023 RepID=UPI002307CCB5|nr:putative uncharacterized protein DDB_G0277255 [Panonychus citri]